MTTETFSKIKWEGSIPSGLFVECTVAIDLIIKNLQQRILYYPLTVGRESQHFSNLRISVSNSQSL